MDPHSLSNPATSRVRHVDLELTLDFAHKVIRGKVRLSLDRSGPLLWLDTRELTILAASVPWHLDAADPILGARLVLQLPPDTQQVEIEYETSPGSTALQWLGSEQTAGLRQPFLFTQSQAAHARSWIPLQDSPAVRVTFRAKITAPEGITVLMAARQETGGTWTMDHPIPSYLIALCAGQLAFSKVSDRCGVWAEPPTLERAAHEFEDLEQMVRCVERLYGPYRWGRFDVLVMPPSFPFGGMENPCLTFATPTILAGDKSLVSLISHELAHSWSGNLVTNATWRDFWLNEGFTTYIERRIQEELYGVRRARMEEALEFDELVAEMKDLKDFDQVLAIDLAGRDPDDGCTLVPYVKGALLLRRLEAKHGRERFDKFIRGYFDHFAFRSITTDDFLDYLRTNLDGEDWSRWVRAPGLPGDAPRPEWHFSSEPDANWSTQEWLQWLRGLQHPDMALIDAQWNFTGTGNAEIAAEWLKMALRNGYAAADARLEQFLLTVGRRKFVKPLFEELTKVDPARARSLFQRASPGYHPITRNSVAAVLASTSPE